MSDYLHGIYTNRKGVQVQPPTLTTDNIIVAVGTAPIHSTTDANIGKPVYVTSKAEADAVFGPCTDYDNYPLPHVIYAAFQKHAVGPVVLINVMDPSKTGHKEAVASTSMTVTDGKVTITASGVLLDTIVVAAGEDTLTPGEDYTTSIDESGYAVISLSDTTRTAVGVAYSKLKPSGVTDNDIIGTVSSTGIKTGLQLADEVYPRFGAVPGYLIAPGFSKTATVAAALEAKARLIYSLTSAVAIVDLNSGNTGATQYSEVKNVKNNNAVASRWCVAVWPMCRADGNKIWFSAMAAALMQKSAADQGGIPSDSPDNLELLIDGICLENGTEVYLTQDIVNDYLNKYGICSALCLPTWKFWGNNTTAYPADTDPINRWIKCVTMLNFMENRFKTQYLSAVGRSANYGRVDSIVGNYNLFLNSLSPTHLAGGKIVFNKAENPIDQILSGKLVFHTRYADYTPAEVIENTFEYDTSILEAALGGE